jgi:hypothetical protein
MTRQNGQNKVTLEKSGKTSWSGSQQSERWESVPGK